MMASLIPCGTYAAANASGTDASGMNHGSIAALAPYWITLACVSSGRAWMRLSAAGGMLCAIFVHGLVVKAALARRQRSSSG